MRGIHLLLQRNPQMSGRLFTIVAFFLKLEGIWTEFTTKLMVEDRRLGMRWRLRTCLCLKLAEPGFSLGKPNDCPPTLCWNIVKTQIVWLMLMPQNVALNIVKDWSPLTPKCNVVFKPWMGHLRLMLEYVFLNECEWVNLTFHYILASLQPIYNLFLQQISKTFIFSQN